MTDNRAGRVVRPLAFLVVLFALAAPAHAGVVSVSRGEFRFEANAGETNLLTALFSVTDPTTRMPEATITDTGAPITAGPGCTAVTAATATCAGSFVYFFFLRDRADTATFTGTILEFGPSFDVRAGGGADVVSLEGLAAGDLEPQVEGQDGGDTLLGGPLPEGFFGGTGRDTVRAGAGNDFIEPGAGDDRVDGGPGRRDEVAFFGAPRGVVVDLAAGRARGWGRDRLTGIENVDGSFFGDVLIGDANANHLFGPAGRDRLFGRGGNDFLEGLFGRDLLVGGRGHDLLSAGEGDDILLARDGERDRVLGGNGRDCALVDRRLDRIRRIERLGGCFRPAAAVTGREEARRT